MAAKQDKRIIEYLNIEGKIHAGMALGIPKFLFLSYMDKNEIMLDKL